MVRVVMMGQVRLGEWKEKSVKENGHAAESVGTLELNAAFISSVC